MTYTALYRKFRPQSFGELVGQEHIGRTLRNALLRGSLVHAYLFSGPRGTGKTSAAKILARAVNCLAPKDGEACLTCPACLRIMAGQSLDIVEIDAASNRGIDEIRDLRERVKYAPVQERYKVYIIDEVHMMTGEAFNALLKTLEEPPEPVIFILATTEPHKIPLTVLSRCQRFDFHRIGEIEIAGRLTYICREEGIAAEESALELIARKAEGGMRDAVGLLDQCAGFAEGTVSCATVGAVLGLVDGDFLRNLAASLCRGELAAVLEAAGQLLDSGHDLRHFSYDLQDHLRHLL
ncbi:MAG: DNA polymerase III subunit gamma/tau, partial [Clostridiales bacterium]|nr:DNA polymerase III subunit gamma/tau [Clostridiales bacterium]